MKDLGAKLRDHCSDNNNSAMNYTELLWTFENLDMLVRDQNQQRFVSMSRIIYKKIENKFLPRTVEPSEPLLEDWYSGTSKELSASSSMDWEMS